MTLRGVKPEEKQKRLKLFLFGPAGVGKTLAALQFPNSYVIDTEKGTDFYGDTIAKAGSMVFQSTNPDEIFEEIRNLLTTKHEFKTLIIDPVTQIYNAVQEKWSRIFEKHAGSEKIAQTQDFGPRYWGRVKSEFKALQRMLMALDMNVIVTAHQKDQYGPGMSKIGVTYDSMKGEDYLYDLVFQLESKGDKRMALTIKERAEIGKAKFPQVFEWNYENFKKFYGAEIIEKAAEPVALASKEQVEKITRLVDIVKIDESEIMKWFSKEDVEEWSEMRADKIQKCIDFVEKKLKEVK